MTLGKLLQKHEAVHLAERTQIQGHNLFITASLL